MGDLFDLTNVLLWREVVGHKTSTWCKTGKTLTDWGQQTLKVVTESFVAR